MRRAGTRDRILEHLQARLNAEGLIDAELFCRQAAGMEGPSRRRRMNVMETTTPTQAPSSQPATPAVPPPDRVRIVSTPGVRGGKPRIDGHRITVADVAVWHERMGMSPDEIVYNYPSITLSDVYAATARRTPAASAT